MIHECTQEEQIKKISLLLLGNGNPRDGYVYKVMDMAEKVENINEKLTGIGGIVKELHEESLGKKAIAQTSHETRTEKRSDKQVNLQTFLLIVAAIGVLFTAYFGYKGSTVPKQLEQTETNLRRNIVEQEGVSKVTRGGYVKFNAGGISDSIKIQ